MGDTTHIGWCDRTFNPWIGCTKISPGCKNCYAETLMDKRYHKVEWGPEGTRVRTSESYWKKPLKWNGIGWLQCQNCSWRGEATSCGVTPRGRLCCPLCSRSILLPTRQRVFCASLADVFEDKPELVEWRKDLFKLIRETPGIDWLILTKRPENIKEMMLDCSDYDWEYSNIWFGTSVENQLTAEQRIPHLLSLPAWITFVSVEPMLGRVDLRKLSLPGVYIDSLGRSRFDYGADGLGVGAPIRKGIDWVICGGESGPGFRSMDPEWAFHLASQCFLAGVPFFMKQMGGHPDKRDQVHDIPPHLFSQEFPR